MKTGQLAAIKIMDVTEVSHTSRRLHSILVSFPVYFSGKKDEEEEIRLEVDVLRKVSSCVRKSPWRREAMEQSDKRSVALPLFICVRFAVLLSSKHCYLLRSVREEGRPGLRRPAVGK